MRIWLAIRRPIGYLIFAALFYFTMIVIHALPILITNAILGIER